MDDGRPSSRGSSSLRGQNIGGSSSRIKPSGSSSRGRAATSAQKLKPTLAKEAKAKKFGAHVEVGLEARKHGHSAQKPAQITTNTIGTPSTTTTTSNNLAPSISTKQRIDTAYDRLCARGIPGEITRDVFERVVLGNAGEGLSEVGAKILSMSEQLRPGPGQGPGMGKAFGGKGKEKQRNEEILNTELECKEESEHEIAYREAMESRSKAHNTLVRGVRRELGVAQKEHDEFDSEKRALESELARKRRTLLMMRVVERREGLRVSRIGKAGSGEEGKGGYAGLIDGLRTRIGCAMIDVEDVLSPNSDMVRMEEMNKDLLKKIDKAIINKAWNYSKTRDALARLHAAHIRRSRMRTDIGEGDIHDRLDRVLRKLSPAGSNEEDLEEMKSKVIALVEKRASMRSNQTRVGIAMPPRKEDAIEVDLDCLLKDVEQAEEELQKRVDRASALEWACLEGVDWISTFKEETVPALSEMLASQEPRVDGYIDQIREGLVGADRSRGKDDNERMAGGLINSVREIVGSVPSRDGDAVLEDVRKLVERVQLGEQILSLRVERPEESGGTISDPLDVNIEDKMVSSIERNKRLLERKGAKIAYGMELAQDVRAVLEGSKLIR